MTDATRAKVPPIVVSYSKVRVSVVEGPDAGVKRELANATLRIGSASDNDLVLNDSTVSRRHCSVEALPLGVRIRDEGSTNGVFIGHLRVIETVATETVDLLLGDTRLRVEPLSETVSREQLALEKFGDLLGRSSRMRELFADLARLAQSDVTLLVQGETGTGKELVADAVHRASRRAERPFVVFDCSAVVSTLIESELFGTVPGAFNGSVNRAGVFEQAHGGTLFLDELGELPKDLQPKLLRVLEKREVKRLGSERVRPVDVRVVSATNRNLAAEVQRGNFREDLYFRLATAEVHIPPLRDRMEDLPLLIEHFLRRAKSDMKVSQISPIIWNAFLHHRWPGNVRELWNTVQRFLISPNRVFLSFPTQPAATTGATPSSPPPAELPAPASSARPTASTPSSAPAPPLSNATPDTLPPLRVARREASDRFEHDYVRRLMKLTGGDRKAAAEIADITREMIRRLLIKHEIE